ncbi:ceramide glucosyltransferase [Geosmithia morbida]|uniref:Ceramide glucosyltransferase n=1 Tax=Geosmithia morbida TaxID=1094350 RepID=A0A9P5D1R2_9HYPO|nr:ceramide glucosyltransferase [Geosmithia morbida]KAF4120736.1 ceramide glucosyltransferase [Geosmithia morbida]
MYSLVEIAAVVCLVWSFFIIVIEAIGITAIFKNFSRPPRAGISPTLGQDAPLVTIIRPVKDLEPGLYECIASSFRQTYPPSRLSIRLCVEDRSDPAYPVLERLVADFPHVDARVMVETDSSATQVQNLGPNPKIRNISRAYAEARGDIIWVMDCNVWAAPGVLGRMVDKLVGYSGSNGAVTPYKLVHQLPIVVDVPGTSRPSTPCLEHQSLLSSPLASSPRGTSPSVLTRGGGRLDEMFMATTHAKFYGAINIVSVAPCIVGKSNMFRKSHLDRATDPEQNPALPKNDYLSRPKGVDYFSHNICEDHSIGELLWHTAIPGHANHGLVWGDLAVQPVSGVPVPAYVARRVRWLRARKFTVLAATLVEPGIESLLCGVYASFGLTTVPLVGELTSIPRTWSAMAVVWLVFVTSWMLADWAVFCRLHALESNTDVEDENTPTFVRRGTTTARSFAEWLPVWIGREVLALPIWTWAVLLGGTINWRGKTFKVRFDTTVKEVPASSESLVNGHQNGNKNRVD